MPRALRGPGISLTTAACMLALGVAAPASATSAMPSGTVALTVVGISHAGNRA